MKIVVFGGTTEGRELSRALAGAGAEVTVCVASAYGEEEQGQCPGLRTHIGPLSAGEKQQLLQDAALCVDATHPYAAHVRGSVREACEKAGVELLRLKREACRADDALLFESAEEAAAYLSRREGRILLTIGTKGLGAFAVLPAERLYPRILPSIDSIAACEAAGIPHRNLIAMQGPFSLEMNVATIRQYGIRYMVSKDGGKPGGFPEKAEAARKTGAQLLLLQRPEDGGLSFEEALSVCMARLHDAASCK